MKKIVCTIACPVFLILFTLSCSISEKAKRYSKHHRAPFRLSQIQDCDESDAYYTDVFSLIYEGSSQSPHGSNNGMIIERRGDAIYISTFVD